MTEKIHGAAYPGIWVERQVVFIDVQFTAPINAIAQDSGFGVVESVVVQVLKLVAQRGTILGVSLLNPRDPGLGDRFQVMLGYASGWFSDADGNIVNEYGVLPATPLTVTGKAVDKTDPLNIVPAADLTATFVLSFAHWDGGMPQASFANGALEGGPGATSGATPPNSPTGTYGYYPKQLH